MQSNIILIDMDNTIADFDGEVVKRFTLRHPGQRALTTGQETRTNWGIAKDVGGKHHDEIAEIYGTPGFTEALPAIPGAIAALKEMLAEGYDVRLCTSPLMRAPHGAGEKIVWAAKMLGQEWMRRIVISSDKTIVRGAVLVDDKIDVTGTQQPEWEHLVFSRPYHAHHADSLSGRHILRSWADWRSVFASIGVPIPAVPSAALQRDAFPAAVEVSVSDARRRGASEEQLGRPKRVRR